MPPLFTSTTVGTLLRKALSAARHVHPVGVPRPSPLIGSKLSPIERARLVARRVVQHAQKTFPSLNTPAHRLGYALEPIRLSTQAARRGLPHQSRSSVQSRLYSTTKATFQAAYRLPAHARGSRVSTSVGLGSARAYSGGAAGGGGAQSLLQNVPLGFRALYEGLKDEDLEGRWPAHTKRYRPYCPVEARHRSRKLRQSRRLDRAMSVACSIDSARTGSFFADRAHYFPLPGRSRGVAAEVPALLVPEALVTPGTTTTLVLPVAATLQAILQPTTHIPYADAELGVAVFAELFAGVGEVALASDTVLGCVLPVLAKLRSLGVLEEHGSERTREGPLVVGSVTRDTLGEPQTIVFDFHDRSESDVRTILGETLKKNVLDQEWWYIQERQSEIAGRAAPPTPSAIESEVNVWADEVAHSVPRAREIEVVMPTMSLDLATVADLSSSWDAQSDREDSMVATPLSALGSELYFHGSVGSVLSDLSPLSSNGDSGSDAEGDGRLAGHFSPHDLRERLALYAHYDGDISGLSDDGSSISGWTSSGPSETDEAVELAVEPVTASYLLPESSSPQGAGIAGFDHGLMLVNYW